MTSDYFTICTLLADGDWVLISPLIRLANNETKAFIAPTRERLLLSLQKKTFLFFQQGFCSHKIQKGIYSKYFKDL